MNVHPSSLVPQLAWSAFGADVFVAEGHFVVSNFPLGSNFAIQSTRSQFRSRLHSNLGGCDLRNSHLDVICGTRVSAEIPRVTAGMSAQEQNEQLQYQQRLEQQILTQQAMLQQHQQQQKNNHQGLLAGDKPQMEALPSGNLPPGFDSSCCRSVYVGNIHNRVSEGLLAEVFASAGPFQSCKLTRKESSYGFVDYFDHCSAAAALFSLDGRHMYGPCTISLL